MAAKEVVLTFGNADFGSSREADNFGHWGLRFRDRAPERRALVPVGAHPTPGQVKAAVLAAIREAAGGGVLIFNVGHGSTSKGSNDAEGTCDLAPNGAFKVVGLNNDSGAVSVFFDMPRVPGQPSDLQSTLKNNPGSARLANWRIYSEMAQACKAARLYRVVFLTCNIGNSTDFVRKIALDWGTVVVAYTRRVGCMKVTTTEPGKRTLERYFLHLEGEDPPYATAEANIVAQEEIPYRPNLSVRIGPAL